MLTELIFTRVIENLDHAILIADKDGSFTLWNKSAKQLLGMSDDIVKVENWQRHFAIFDMDGIRYRNRDLPIMKAVNKGEISVKERLYLTSGTKDGVYLEVDAFPIINENDEIVGGVASFTDVTQKMKTEKFIDDVTKMVDQIRDLLKNSILSPIDIMGSIPKKVA